MARRSAFFFSAALACVPLCATMRTRAGHSIDRGTPVSELWESDRLLVVRMRNPECVASLAANDVWTGVSTTWFGQHVAKHDDEKERTWDERALFKATRWIGCVAPPKNIQNDVQKFFPTYFGDAPWYLLLDAVEATSFGALAGHMDLYVNNRGKYYTQVDVFDNEADTKSKRQIRRRNFTQAQEFIADDSPESSAEQIKFLDVYTPGATHKCLPCGNESPNNFAKLQKFMSERTDLQVKKHKWNEVYLAKVMPKAIVGIMHSGYVFQPRQPKFSEDPEDTRVAGLKAGGVVDAIKDMKSKLELLLNTKLPVFAYGVDSKDGHANRNFAPVEMSLGS